MSCRDLDLDVTIPNVEFIRDIFIYYNIFKLQVPRFKYLLSYHAYRHTERLTDTHAETCG